MLHARTLAKIQSGPEPLPAGPSRLLGTWRVVGLRYNGATSGCPGSVELRTGEASCGRHDVLSFEPDGVLRRPGSVGRWEDRGPFVALSTGEGVTVALADRSDAGLRLTVTTPASHRGLTYELTPSIAGK